MRRESHVRFCEGLGVRFPRATRLVVMCRTRADADETMRVLKEIFGTLRLELHPDKTRLVELGLGLDGFVFLGCYLRIIRSKFKNRDYLFRWPSPRAMNSIRAKIRALTDRRRRAGMEDIWEVIEDLNPVLSGWSGYFRTGNASEKFNQIDRFVRARLCRLLARRGDQRRNKPGGKPFNPKDWPHSRFVDEHGLYKLLGTIRYPERSKTA